MRKVLTARAVCMNYGVSGGRWSPGARDFMPLPEVRTGEDIRAPCGVFGVLKCAYVQHMPPATRPIYVQLHLAHFFCRMLVLLVKAGGSFGRPSYVFLEKRHAA